MPVTTPPSPEHATADGAPTPVPVTKAVDMDRPTFVNAVTNLAPADFTRLKTLTGATWINQFLDVPTAASQLIEWAESTKGCGLDQLKRHYDQTFNRRGLPRPETPIQDRIAAAIVLGLVLFAAMLTVHLVIPDPPNTLTLDQVIGSIDEFKRDGNPEILTPVLDLLKPENMIKPVEWKGVVVRSEKPAYVVTSKGASDLAARDSTHQLKPHELVFVTLDDPGLYEPRSPGSPIHFKGTFARCAPEDKKYGLAVAGAELLK